MSIYDHLEFRHLKYILAIAESGTFSAAAASIPISQSSLSRQVQEIEDVFGIRIFDRDTAGTALTEVGELLVRCSRELLETRAEIVRTSQAVQQATAEPFRLGFTPLIHGRTLAEVCGVYRRLFPRGQIYPECEDSTALIKQLHSGDLDAGLMTLPVDSGTFRIQPLTTDPLMACIRKDDPLAENREIPPSDLKDRLWVFGSPGTARLDSVLMERLKEQGIEARIASAKLSGEHIQSMVEEGICIALIRVPAVLSQQLTTRPIAGLNWSIDSVFLCKAETARHGLPLLLRALERRIRPSRAEPAIDNPSMQAGPHRQERLPFGPRDLDRRGAA